MTRGENIDPESVVGSFAGAIGIPQFMPSSYEAYSVDFNGNGQRDLVNETDDAIGSVANYLSVHGWESGQKIYAQVDGALPAGAASLVSHKAKLIHDRDGLASAGVNFDQSGSSARASLVSLSEENGPRYIVGFRNLYAITRYNPSVNYAMAVAELSEAIELKFRSP
jgi:membrane-bound lytic murein transglycosylase B